MRSERDAIKRIVQMPVDKVELKGVYLLLREIQDDIVRIKNELSLLRQDLLNEPDDEQDEP